MPAPLLLSGGIYMELDGPLPEAFNRPLLLLAFVAMIETGAAVTTELEGAVAAAMAPPLVLALLVLVLALGGIVSHK